MSLGRAVPWCSWDEWRQVGAWLTSLDGVEVQRGLDRVCAWRVRGRVPLGVDTTACLVETKLREQQSALSEALVRLQYAMAVVRLVNGIADSSQRGKVAASVSSLADNAGLPRLLVDLRHEATHNELPSLAVLHLAAHHALTWLQTNYWQRQAIQLEESMATAAQLVQEYVDLHLAAACKAAAAGARGTSDSSSDDEHAGGGDGAAGEVYDPVQARKRRQAVLTELRARVPRPAAPLLVDALLAAGQEAGRAASGEVVAKALGHTLSHMVKEWPQLPALVTQAVVRVCVAAESNAANSERPLQHDAAAVWNLWGQLLVPAAGRKPAVWVPSEQQLKNLLGQALPAYAAAAQAAAPGAGGGMAAPLLQLIQALMGRVKSKEVHAKCAGLLESIDQLASGQVSAGGGKEGQGKRPAATEAQGAAGGRPAKRAAGREPVADQPLGTQKRWRRLQEWQPCAVGLLPAAMDPNGRLPPLSGSAIASLNAQPAGAHGTGSAEAGVCLAAAAHAPSGYPPNTGEQLPEGGTGRDWAGADTAGGCDETRQAAADGRPEEATRAGTHMG